MINIIAWILFGALVGWVASMIVGTDEKQGGVMNILVGIAGALIGGFITRSLGGQGVSGFNGISFMVALLGAIVLLMLYRLVSRAK